MNENFIRIIIKEWNGFHMLLIWLWKTEDGESEPWFEGWLGLGCGGARDVYGRLLGACWEWFHRML